MKKIFAIVLLANTLLFAESSFFANPEIQALAPNAFALQKEAAAFVLGIGESSLPEREALVRVIQEDSELKNVLSNWTALTIEEQIPFLRRIFDLEVKVLGIKAPELVIKSGIINGPAYFDFDPTKPGAGRVLLNPDALKKEDKYASLSLLIHETRHSAQFQMAFPVNPSSPFSVGYQAAFTAQKSLKGKLSFCDFLTLLNEYEAFQFGNYVVGRLTDWKVDIVDMGTFASQYDSHGNLKIDLTKLVKEVGQDKLLETFNELEKVQKELISPTGDSLELFGGCPKGQVIASKAKQSR
jgi:hypothetical protein